MNIGTSSISYDSKNAYFFDYNYKTVHLHQRIRNIHGHERLSQTGRRVNISETICNVLLELQSDEIKYRKLVVTHR